VHDLVRRARAAFQQDATSRPPLTMRGGSDLDGYDRPRPFDPSIDEPTDAYLEGFTFHGLVFLDGQSWRHYLPRLIEYAFTHTRDPGMAVEALVRSLRPPDRYPPRLATLTEEQETVVREFLEMVAFGDLAPDLGEEARQALEEWWLPNPRARPTPDEIAAFRSAPVTYRLMSDDRYRLAVPDTLTDTGVKDIPQESRRVRTWGGYICGDVHTVIAVNVTPLQARSLHESVSARGVLFREAVTPSTRSVPGSRRAERLDGQSLGESPAQPRRLVMLFAEAGSDLVTLSVHTWDREDVRPIIEHIVGSLEIVPA
jgi:uncharacterized protein DUF6714